MKNVEQCELAHGNLDNIGKQCDILQKLSVMK